MKVTLPILLSLALLFGSAASCKTTKEGNSGRRLNANATLKACLKGNEIPDFMQINGRADAGMAGRTIGFSYRIHLKKDNLIWIKVTKFGFEGLRALIRPDSVFVINRLEKSYAASDYSIVKDFTGLDADFGLIQDMLVGNFHPIPDPTTLKVTDRKSNPLEFTGGAADYQFAYDIESPQNRLVGMKAVHESRDEFMELLYTAFENVAKGQTFATQGELTVGLPDTARVAFNHTKIDLDPGNLSFSFKVPSNYSKSK